MINWELVALYIGMVIVALVSYAVVIPYFIVRRIRKMVDNGEMAELIFCALMSKIKKEDGTETTVAQLLVSVGINNLKMQFNSLKSAVVRGLMCGEGGEDVQSVAMEQYLQSVPKKWRWIIPLMLPVMAKMQQQPQHQPQQNQGGVGL